MHQALSRKEEAREEEAAHQEVHLIHQAVVHLDRQAVHQAHSHRLLQVVALTLMLGSIISFQIW
jgi:hypothetical protein